MNEGHPHPLLQQLPLTVSPYLSLPTATPLPYTYKSLPSTLPPSATSMEAPTADPNQQQTDPQQEPKPAYVVSHSGHAAHPDSIIESCRALQAHLDKLQAEAEAAIRRWDGDIRERELAEKRRVAPGWLDVGEEGRMLVPESSMSAPQRQQEMQTSDRAVPMMGLQSNVARVEDQAGEELDRAFGGLNVNK